MNDETMRTLAMRAKRWNIILFCVFGVIFAFVLTAVCLFQYEHTYSRAKWEHDRANRYKIVYDMLDRNQLVGMTEAEVLHLLGGEDGGGQTSFKISKEYFPPESTLVYDLGVDWIDSNWLVISLDDGVVTKYCIDLT